MKIYQLHRELWIPQPLPAVFGFFTRAENLERITPPWLRFRIVFPPPVALKQGTIIRYALRVRGIPIRWTTEIEVWNPPFEFVDVQVKGPYRIWRHTHRFSEAGGGTSMSDTVDYALPLGVLGRLVHRLQVARDLARIFDYRAQRVQALVAQGEIGVR